MNRAIKPEIKSDAVTLERSKLWTGNFILAWFTSLFAFMAFDSMVPVLPLYMEVHEGISGAAGFPMAALTLGALLARPFTGWALDRYGRKRVQRRR